MQIKVKTPAKINLTLEIVNKRPDGFHNIKSVMQLIDLYDFITVKALKSDSTIIKLSGNSDEIPYNEKNLVYKATRIFLEKTGISDYEFDIYIEKNIPVSAGLAGGSTNAAGTLYALNRLFDDILSKEELHSLCEQLGSDLNVCLEGGCLLATSRGEVIEKLPFRQSSVSLIKPLNLGISAKEAYTKYSLLENKPNYDMTSKMIDSIKIGTDLKQFLYNDLETAVFNDYIELQKIKEAYPDAIMSGSGSTYFRLDNNINLLDGYWTKSGLKFISTGVEEV
ncbi:MAG: 4-(cytidine 5'-diphospho)-2-C-methyl-D-erythritol kinase [Muribaculaceae bacterium]|nr:4-(cytidine 5'-diphospho)-2-C-methyl-D-erythritol kinase [Muribaculaceae bacterium]